MKLNELVGIKKFNGLTRDQVMDIATKTGAFTALGKGIASHVVEYEGVVYKFWFEDDGYEKFIELAQSTKNSFYPKFLSGIKTINSDFLNKHKTAPSVIKYIKMEKLKVNSESTRITGDIEIGSELTISLADAIYFTKYIVTPYFTVIKDNKQWLAKCLVLQGKNPTKHPIVALDSPEEGEYIESLNANGKELLNALVDMAELAKSTGQNLDTTKNENFALRGNQIVFLDPFISLKTVNRNTVFKSHEDRAKLKSAESYKKKSFRKK